MAATSSQGALPPMTRPWQSEVPCLPETVTETIHFPTDEEDDGLARIAWRGPSALVCVHVVPCPDMHVACWTCM